MNPLTSTPTAVGSLELHEPLSKLQVIGRGLQVNAIATTLANLPA